HRRVPVEAAVEGRMKLARRARVLVAREQMQEVIRIRTLERGQRLGRDRRQEVGRRAQGSLGSPGSAGGGAGSFLLRVTNHTAAVHVGRRPTPGINSAANVGKKARCQPRSRIMTMATIT